MKTTGRKTVKGDKVSAPKAVKATSSKATSEAKPATTMPASAPTAMSSSKSVPTHEEIAMRSYELYLARGSIDGYAEEDWARAESELLSH